jgi:MFS family permease
VLARTLVTGIAGGSVSALMPIVTRDLLLGDARTYGIMLGTFGMGAVVGALNVSALRARIADEIAIRLCVIVMGAGVATVAMSRSRLLTAGALLFAGAAWTASVTLFNVGVQLAAPRWVAGRALAAYQAAIAGGIAIGSWVWGSTASLIGVKGALLISGAALVASSALGLWMRMPTISGPNELSLDIPPDPELRLSLTPRSGPIVIEIEYRVAPARARLFYAVMQQVQHSRQRNGAYGWSIARDIADPELWTERFHCPTWHDYLRQRNRSTESERALHIRATDFHMGPEPIRIRRMLERPIGSVRWKDETPDRSITDHAPIAGPGSGA